MENCKYIIPFIILFISFQAIAQPGKGRQSWQDNYEIAQELLAESSYYNASEYLIKALELKGSNDPNLIYLIAQTFMNARDYKNAADYFNMTLKYDSDGKFKDARWYYAQMLKQNSNYDAAINQFRMLENIGYSKSHLIENEIKGCELALSGKEASIQSLKVMDGINSNYTEYAPMPLKEGEFIYSSLNSNDLIYTQKEMVFSKIYKTTCNDGKITDKGAAFSESINKPNYHNGHGTYSDDGKRFYFTRCETQADHLPVCKIFVSTFRDDKWSEATQLGVNINGNHSASNPYFKNGKLYFSSDRQGGFGGMDLWVATINHDGSFASPTNLGRHVNTAADEITPYYDHESKIIYFSSNGLAGYGGFDIFKSEKKNGVFNTTNNMYHPINSAADDMYFILDETLQRGYFSSNRLGTNAVDNATCCDDIFTLLLSSETGDVSVEGYVYKKGNESRNPIDGATLELFEIDGGGNLISIDTWITENQEPYQFRLNSAKKYVIKASKPTFKDGEETIIPRGKANLFKDIPIDKDCIELSGLVYEDDSKNLRILDGALVQLVETKSNGERVVVSETVSTINGYILCAPADKKMKMIISKDGVLTDSYNVDTYGANEPGKFDIILRKDQMNVGFKIDNILYDFNSSILRTESKTELDKIYQLMVLNPRVILELGSHTDNKGTVEYNLGLSQRRAKSAVEYLVSKGIPSYRLKHEGYGELQPVAPNRNPDGTDNPDGRQLNRRTEFKIVGKLSE